MAPAKETTLVIRKELEKACKEFTDYITPSGFQRTRKMFWTRRHRHSVDFIYFFRSGSSYGASYNYDVSIEVHFGIRVLNDDLDGPHLNGPNSDPTLTRKGQYHLRFNAKSGSMYERCVEDLVRFVVEQGEPWFREYETEKNLLKEDSPLRPEAKQLLQAAMDGKANPENEALSLKSLGIKRA